MSSTYGWLTESALAIERPVPLRGVSQQSQVRLASIIRKHQQLQQKQLSEQRPLFAAAARAGKVFTHHDASCDRRWTRPTEKCVSQPLDWAERQLARKNEGVSQRRDCDEADTKCHIPDIDNVGAHLENKAKLYDRIVGGLSHNTSASHLLQLRQKRRNAQRRQHLEVVHEASDESTEAQLSTEALAEFLNLPDGQGASANETQNADQQTVRLAFLQARLNLYRYVLSRTS